MKRSYRFLLAGGILVVALSAAAVVVLRPFVSSEDLLRPDDVRLVAQGAEVYEAACATCHGANLEGQENWRRRNEAGLLPAPPHDESGHTWHHPDQMLFELTKYGLQYFAGEDYRTWMPAFEELLSDDEIIAVLSFIKSRWPEDIRRRHDMLNEQARGDRAQGG